MSETVTQSFPRPEAPKTNPYLALWRNLGPQSLLKRGARQVLGWAEALLPETVHQAKYLFFRSEWEPRIREVLASPDNALLARVPDAGRVVAGFQIMHNGLRIRAGSYCGTGGRELLRRSRGVVEPQQERLFEEVLRDVSTGGCMLELGAYWSFYSLWFCHVVPDGRAYMVEGDLPNLACGRANFAANNQSGRFTHALVGSASGTGPEGLRQLCLDDFLPEQGLARVDILHCDIQGHELEMLHGAEHSFAQRRIRYLFLSTHSEALHRDCAEWLQARGYCLLVSVPLTESKTDDGLLLAVSPLTSPSAALRSMM